MFPGFDGGMEWGGGAADPDGVYYVNVNEIPWLMQMVETRRADGTPLPRGERDYMLNCAPCHGLDRKGNLAAKLTQQVGGAVNALNRDVVETAHSGLPPGKWTEVPHG